MVKQCFNVQIESYPFYFCLCVHHDAFVYNCLNGITANHDAALLCMSDCQCWLFSGHSVECLFVVCASRLLLDVILVRYVVVTVLFVR